MSIYYWILIIIIILIIISIIYFLMLNNDKRIMLDVVDNQLSRVKNLNSNEMNAYIKDYLAMSKQHPEFFGTGKDITFQREFIKNSYNLFELQTLINDFRTLNDKYNISMKG